MRLRIFAAGLLTLLALAAAARAQDAESHKTDAKPVVGPKLGQEHVQKYRFGVVVKSVGGTMSRKSATTTVPTDWPEQIIKIIGQDLSHGVTIGYRSYGTAKQLVVNVPRLAADEEAHGIIIAEVKRYTLESPDDKEHLVAPVIKSLPAEMKQYLSPSPTIESNNAKVKAVAREILEVQADKAAWRHVRAIYDWVRANIKYVARNGGNFESESSASSCVVAMEKGEGNCNELTSTFIAICRASGIPARTVRIPGHCYTEFYLEGGYGHGGWFPAEVSGEVSFGSVFTTSPIMQKGDSFKYSVMDQSAARPRMKTEVGRFLHESISGTSTAGDTGQPTMKIICEPVKE